MATSKEFHDHILSVLDGCEKIRTRKMMGEYLLYYKDKLIGGLYDDKLLLKDIRPLRDIHDGSEFVIPYEGAKEMFHVIDTENKEEIFRLFELIYDFLPESAKNKK